jgi:hypothetical protein
MREIIAQLFGMNNPQQMGPPTKEQDQRMNNGFSLASLFGPNSEGQTNAFGSNPSTLSLAGLLQAQGVPANEAYTKAAQIVHNKEQSLIQKQKHAFEQNQSLQRNQGFQKLGNVMNNPDNAQSRDQALNKILLSGAFEPSEAKVLKELYGTPMEDTKEIFGKENKLRDEFIQQSKSWKEINDAYPKILAAAQDPSPAGDISLLYGFMKLNDPTSTVRESEYATAENAAGVPDRIRQQYNKALNGEKLTNNMRADFIKRAGQLYASQYKNQTKLTQQYEALAGRNKVNPKNVIIDYNAGSDINPINKHQNPANPQPTAEGVFLAPQEKKQSVYSREELEKEMRRRKDAGLL